jgi:hypothetical protein
MRHGRTLGGLALLMRLGREEPERSDCANLPANDLHEPHVVMISGRRVEIANGQ